MKILAHYGDGSPIFFGLMIPIKLFFWIDDSLSQFLIWYFFVVAAYVSMQAFSFFLTCFFYIHKHYMVDLHMDCQWIHFFFFFKLSLVLLYQFFRVDFIHTTVN